MNWNTKRHRTKKSHRVQLSHSPPSASINQFVRRPAIEALEHRLALDGMAPLTEVAASIPSLETEVVSNGTSILRLQFTQAIDPSSLSLELRGNGPNQLMGDSDDDLFSLSSTVQDNLVSINLAPLNEGLYRLTVFDTVTDQNGQAIDGDRDGVAGGNYITDFVVNSTVHSADLVSRVSIDGVFQSGAGDSYTTFGRRSISEDGRYIAFASDADDLVPGDFNSAYDIFRLDNQTGEIVLASVSLNGLESGNADSFDPVISADGNRIAFESLASNLTDADDNGGFFDVFVRDFTSNSTTLVSIPTSGTGFANGASFNPVLSANGNVVVFGSRASNLVMGDVNGVEDVFAFDYDTGLTDLVSVSLNGTSPSNGRSSDYGVSGDGQRIVFESTGDNLVINDSNGQSDVFLRDLESNNTTLVSTTADGLASANGESADPVISLDGNLVAFESSATDLAPGDADVLSDIYLMDLAAGTVSLVSRSPISGLSGNGVSYDPLLTEDGGTVLFESTASDLVTGDANSFYDVFAHEIDSGNTELISIARTGLTSGNGNSFDPSVSSDGRYVVFESSSSNLTTSDSNSNFDVFLRDRLTGATRILSTEPNSEISANNGSYDPTISADGSLVVFASVADNLVPIDTNNRQDLFAIATAARNGQSDLPSAGDTIASVDRIGLGTGQLLFNGDGPLDGLNRLRIDDIDFAPTIAGELREGGRIFVSESQSLSGLTVRREVEVPDSDAVDFIRTLEVLENSGTSDISISATILGNLNNDGQNTMVDTSDGDNLAERSDRWIATSNASDPNAHTVLHSFRGTGGIQPTTVDVDGDNVWWNFDVNVPAGQTVRLATLTLFASSAVDAVNALDQLVTPNGVTQEFGIGFEQSEIDSLLNFGINQPPISRTGGPYRVDEGTSLELNASASSDLDTPNGNLMFEWDLDFDGTNFDADQFGEMPNVSFADGDAALDIALRVTDEQGLSNVATTTLTVDNVVPSLSLGEDATLQLGDQLTFQRSISFLDPGEDSWSGTVDYGDGSGETALLIDQSTKSFELRRAFAEPGQYEVTVGLDDGDGGEVFESVTVTVPDSAFPTTLIGSTPDFSAGVLREGQTELALQFSQPIDLGNSLIELRNLGTNGLLGDGDDTVIPVSTSVDESSLLLTFTPLPESIYRLTVPDTITSMNGDAIDGDDDGEAGGDYEIDFVVTQAGLEFELISRADSDRLSDSVGNQFSSRPNAKSISGDGRFIVYSIDAPHLVSTDTDASSDVFRYDRQTDSVELVSISFDGLSSGNGGSWNPSISSDGRFVAYISSADNLTDMEEAASSRLNVFLWDSVSGETTLVTRRVEDSQVGITEFEGVVISGDGSVVAYEEGRGTKNVFAFDVDTGETTLLSRSLDGTSGGNNKSEDISISDDGNFIVFESLATNLSEKDTDSFRDVYAYDLSTEKITLISESFDAASSGNQTSSDPIVSADGRFIAFSSLASNLVSIDTNAKL